MQSNDLQSIQENIVGLAYDVDEIRRNKSSLEIEIIIYRQLLECCGIEVPAEITTHHTHIIDTSKVIIPPPVVPQNQSRTAKISIKKEKKGFISISK